MNCSSPLARSCTLFSRPENVRVFMLLTIVPIYGRNIICAVMLSWFQLVLLLAPSFGILVQTIASLPVLFLKALYSLNITHVITTSASLPIAFIALTSPATPMIPVYPLLLPPQSPFLKSLCSRVQSTFIRYHGFLFMQVASIATAQIYTEH